MNFELSEEQKMIQQSVERFVQENYDLPKRVLVIEAGPQIKRKEAINDEPKATFNRLSGLLSKKHAKQSQHPGYWKNNPNLYINELKHPYNCPTTKPFLWTQGNQYGGRSLTWGGITLRFSPDDFHPAKKDGFGPNWPISYDELSPHYDFIEQFCGCFYYCYCHYACYCYRYCYCYC